MNNLLKIELFKIKNGKEKYIIIISFVFMILSSSISILFSESSYNITFATNIYRFFEYNFQLLFPLSIGIFTIAFICKEFKNKTIKYYIMSKYNRLQFFIAKFIATNIFIILSFIITFFTYSIIAYYLSDKQQVIINYSNIQLEDIIFKLIIFTILICLYISCIISFTTFLSYISKKQSVSILVFIIINSLMLLFFGGVYELSVIPRYTFFYAAELYSLIWDPDNIYLAIRYGLPCLSNLFLFLSLSLLSFDKYEYQ